MTQKGELLSTYYEKKTWSESSDDDNSEAEQSQYHSSEESSFSVSSDEEEIYDNDIGIATFSGLISSLRLRRRGGATTDNFNQNATLYQPRYEADGAKEDSDDGKCKQHSLPFFLRQRTRQRARRERWSTSVAFPMNSWRSTSSCLVDVGSGFFTLLVCSSLLVWVCMMVLQYSTGMITSDMIMAETTQQHHYVPDTRERIRIYTAAKRKQKEAQALTANDYTVANFLEGLRLIVFGSSSKSPVDSFHDGEKNTGILQKPFNHPNVGRREKPEIVEFLPPDCERLSWHNFSFPNGNTIHEIDLTNPKPKMVRYIASGLWRDVWAIRPTSPEEKPLILKVMKSEHDVTKRNLERHRRDALVMERLTSSPFVVDVYGYSGNTVMTEYVETTLSDILYEHKTRSSKRKRQNGGADINEGSNTTRANVTHEGSNTTRANVTRKTRQGRLALALGVARGVQAIHDFPDGPIVHADITAKQFLVTKEGKVKLNDFNRCRFMALNVSDNTPCNFRIPSAPGKERSPEEYGKKELDENIDMYSLANVLYGILTGEKAWETLHVMDAKSLIQKGARPNLDEGLYKPGAPDEILSNLTDAAYSLQPHDRISANELVLALERLVDTVL